MKESCEGGAASSEAKESKMGTTRKASKIANPISVERIGNCWEKIDTQCKQRGKRRSLNARPRLFLKTALSRGLQRENFLVMIKLLWEKGKNL